MNKFLKQQLDRIQVDYEIIDDTHIVIKKTPLVKDFHENESYIIHLKDYLINEPENFTLSTNWNNGIKPKSEYMTIFVNKINGKMLKVDGVGYDNDSGTNKTDCYTDLWLPRGGIEMIKAIRN